MRPLNRTEVLKLIAFSLHYLSIKQADGAMGYLGTMAQLHLSYFFTGTRTKLKLLLPACTR